MRLVKLMIFSLMNKDKFMGSLRFKDGNAIIDGQIP